MNCAICGAEVSVCKDIQGLYFCNRCNRYGYLPADKEAEYDIPLVLKSLSEINPLVDLFTSSTVALLGDVCDVDQRILHLCNELVTSEFPLKKKLREVNSEQEIEVITEQICHRLLFDSLTCEYVVRAFAFAIGKSNMYKTVGEVLDLRRKNGVIASFDVSRKSVRIGEYVDIHWKLNSRDPMVRINVGNMEIITSQTEEGQVRYTVGNDCEITLTAIDRITGAELAVQRKKVSVAKPPIIKAFSCNNKRIIEGDSTFLSWDVSNCEKLTLMPDRLDVTNKTSLRVFPKASVEYILLADNAVGERADSRLIIDVRELPKITLPKSLSINSINLPKYDANIPSIGSFLKTKESTEIFGETANKSKRINSLISSLPIKIQSKLNKKQNNYED